MEDYPLFAERFYIPLQGCVFRQTIQIHLRRILHVDFKYVFKDINSLACQGKFMIGIPESPDSGIRLQDWLQFRGKQPCTGDKSR